MLGYPDRNEMFGLSLEVLQGYLVLTFLGPPSGQGDDMTEFAIALSVLRKKDNFSAVF